MVHFMEIHGYSLDSTPLLDSSSVITNRKPSLPKESTKGGGREEEISTMMKELQSGFLDTPFTSKRILILTFTTVIIVIICCSVIYTSLI